MPKLYTIGHSTHTMEDFLALLQAYEITCLVDVRTIPKSRYVPWFNEDTLCEALHKEKIAYIHMSELGGLRHTAKDSINQGWHNKSFQGYADYMQTPEFHSGLKMLNQLLKEYTKIVIMCAEAVAWRCHRSLIADAELVRGVHVFHILSKTNTYAHKLTSFAVVDKTKRPIKIFYPKEEIG